MDIVLDAAIEAHKRLDRAIQSVQRRRSDLEHALGRLSDAQLAEYVTATTPKEEEI